MTLEELLGLQELLLARSPPWPEQRRETQETYLCASQKQLQKSHFFIALRGQKVSQDKVDFRLIVEKLADTGLANCLILSSST